MDLETEIFNNFNQLRKVNFGARFYKVDLHFHTPASKDAIGKNRYDFAPYKTKFPPKTDNLQVYQTKVENIQKEVIKKSREIARDMINKWKEEKVSIVAVTDHNGIGTLYNDHTSKKNFMDLKAKTWYELISEEINETFKGASRKPFEVLPGVEISTAGVHILAIFPPQEPKNNIKFIINELLDELGLTIKKWGIVREIGNTGIYKSIELIHKKGGIPIIAHIDGTARNLLGLYKINSNSMKNEITNEYLPAVEIVKTKTIRKILGEKNPKALYDKFYETRKKAGLKPLAYVQGSDAHCVKDIAKRFSYIKMSEPSYFGLKDAIQFPSSRIRLSERYEPLKNGIFLYGLKLDSDFFKEQYIRFNRHFNCIIGKKESGKSSFLDFLSKPLFLSKLNKKGNITLYIEKIENYKSLYYALHINNKSEQAEFLSLNKKTERASKLNISKFNQIHFSPEYLVPEKINELISDSDKLNSFINERFGTLSQKKNRDKFNRIFSLTDFLGEHREQLICADRTNGNIKLFLNANWRRGKEKMVEFIKLRISQKTVFLICMIIIGLEGSPILIDEIDNNLDNEDIVEILIPVIKKFKDYRQLILATSNPLLAANSDPENYILLERKSPNKIIIQTGFSLDKEETKSLKDQLIKVLDGSKKELENRALRYKI